MRDPYDGLRPWSAITHGIGAALAVVGTVFLAVQSAWMGKWENLVLFLIYGVSMVCLYTASTLYHCVNTTRSKRIALRKYDHCSIYLLIAVSYTPRMPPRCCGKMAGCPFLLRSGAWLWPAWCLPSPSWISPVAHQRHLPGDGLAGPVRHSSSVPADAWAGYVLAHSGRSFIHGGRCALCGEVARAQQPRFGCHEIFHVFILLGSIAHFMMMAQVIAYL